MLRAKKKKMEGPAQLWWTYEKEIEFPVNIFLTSEIENDIIVIALLCKPSSVSALSSLLRCWSFVRYVNWWTVVP